MVSLFLASEGDGPKEPYRLHWKFKESELVWLPLCRREVSTSVMRTIRGSKVPKLNRKPSKVLCELEIVALNKSIMLWTLWAVYLVEKENHWFRFFVALRLCSCSNHHSHGCILCHKSIGGWCSDETTRGDPPLKKLITKFIAFATEMEKDGNNFNDSEKLYKSFLQDLATFELPLLKTMAMINANKWDQENFTNLSSGT